MPEVEERKVSQPFSEILPLPGIDALYSHSKDLSEKIVCDESTLINITRELEELNEKTSIMEGSMWLHICNLSDNAGKPIYSNDRQRQAAYDSLVSLCKTDSPKIPANFKEYREMSEQLRSVKGQIDVLKISIEAMRRVFNLNVAVIRSLGVS